MLKENQNLLQTGFLNRVKREIVIPELRARKRQLGKLYYVDISCVETDAQHEKRHDILTIFNRGLIYSIKNVSKSEYYRYQIFQKRRSQKDTWKKLLKYYLLFRSIKKYGFKVDHRRIDSFPWVFVANKIRSRFDGHHRASIAKFLGYSEIPVLLITPGDILKLKNLPNDIVKVFMKLEDPDLKVYRPYEVETEYGESVKANKDGGFFKERDRISG